MQSQNIGHVGTGKVHLIEQLDKLQQGSFGAGDGGWNDACGSVTKMRPACAIDRVEVTVHKVKPARAVRVRFDEAGRKVFPYPDAFERFLCFDDPILQKRAEAAVMELKKKRTEEAKQRLVVYQLYEAKRKQEQTELLKKRRKAARERLAREKMAKVI